MTKFEIRMNDEARMTKKVWAYDGRVAKKQKKTVRAWWFFRRGLRLRCPECGQARIFKPWRATRSLDDWFRPLDGCPNCEFRYEPEEGYFLVATWVMNYAVVVGFGFL